MFRKLLVASGVLIVGLGIATPAWAHVTVNPHEAAKGGFATLTFQVPNERDNASTTALEVNFPTDHPIAFVSVKAEPGWTYKVEKQKLATPIESEGESIDEAVSKITWSGGAIKPGEFGAFQLSAGPLPEDTDQLEFKALQTYDNGEVVRWIDPTPASGEEPEHPAPVLKLTAATGDEHGAGSTPAAAKDDEGEDDDDDSQTLALVGVGLGGIALIAAIGALARGRRS